VTLTGDIPLDLQQHIVLDDVSWDLYEHLLDEVGDRPIRMTYDDGRLEIMSPLPKHNRWSRRIGSMIHLACVELNIPMVPLGSTTFRDAAKKKGLEPDECFYLKNADAAMKMEKAFDPAVDPPPDLAIEVDITRRSIARQPIYAALGIPELWRFDGTSLTVLALRPDGRYQPQADSVSFPFLPVPELDKFLARLRTENDTAVMRSFQQWVRTLKR
jgi:Uma2 family endonuclease